MLFTALMTDATVTHPKQAFEDTFENLQCPLPAAPTHISTDLWERALKGPLRDILSRPGKQFRSRLVQLAWRLAGRDDAPPKQLPLVVELLHAGSLIIDDIEDGSEERRGKPALHRLHGIPVALNTGNWLYFYSIRTLQSIPLSTTVRSQLEELTNSIILMCHEGQALDLTARVTQLQQNEVASVVQTISEYKTGALMALASGMGAIAAGAENHIRDALLRFGSRLGVGLQMQNDLTELYGTNSKKKYEDLILGRATWPWRWVAESATASEFSHLQTLSTHAGRFPETAQDLADALRVCLEDKPKVEIHKWLENAFTELEEVLGQSTYLDALHEEVRRLENHYA
ncbi:MAG: polyprenyl synthetase family protein [Gemmataceae bacterium]